MVRINHGQPTIIDHERYNDGMTCKNFYFDLIFRHSTSNIMKHKKFTLKKVYIKLDHGQMVGKVTMINFHHGQI